MLEFVLLKYVVAFLLFLGLVGFINHSCVGYYPKAKISAKQENSDSEIIKLSFVTQNVGKGPLTDGFNAFRSKLEELSGSTMTIEIIQLIRGGAPIEMFNATIAGNFDIVGTIFSEIDEIVPEIELINSIYLIRDYEHFDNVVKNILGEKINSQLADIGGIVCGSWYLGARQFLSNKPLNSWEDIKGQNIRIPQSKNSIAFIEALGATPIVASLPLTYDLIKSGEVDAHENPLVIIESTKMYEMQKYLAITDHFITLLPIMVNQAKYDSLTEQQQQWLVESIKYAGDVCREVVYEEEARLIEKFETQYGMIVTHLDKDEGIKLMANYYANLEERFGANLIAEIRAQK